MVGGNDHVSFNDGNMNHVFGVKDVESIFMPNVGSNYSFALNIRSAGTTTINMSNDGANLIAGTPEDGTTALNQHFFFSDNAGSSNTLELTGSTGDDVAQFASGADVIEGMTGVENVFDGGGDLEFKSALSGVTIAVNGTGGTLTLDDVGNTITISQLSSVSDTNFTGHTDSVTWTSVVGGSGVDSVTVHASSNDATVNNFNGGGGSDTLTVRSSGSTGTDATVHDISNVETLVGTKDSTGSVIVSLDDGGVTISSVSGTFDSFTGGSGTDIVNASSDGVTLGNVSLLETIAGGSGTDSVTLKDSITESVVISGVETINGGSGGETITSTGSQTTTITGNGGADTLNLNGSGAHHVVHAGTSSHGSDTINGFDAGTGSDVLGFTASSLSNGGNSTTLQEITSATATLADGFLFYAWGGSAFDGVDGSSAVAVATAAASFTFTNIAAGEKILFIVDNGTNSYVWHFTEDGDPKVENNGDLVLLETITGVADAATFDDGDFTTV